MSRERETEPLDDFMHKWLQNRYDKIINEIKYHSGGCPTFYDIDCVCWMMPDDRGPGAEIMIEKKMYMDEMPRNQAFFMKQHSEKLERGSLHPGDFRGFHLLQFNNTAPYNSSVIKLDRKDISVSNLDLFLTNRASDDMYITYFIKIPHWESLVK